MGMSVEKEQFENTLKAQMKSLRTHVCYFGVGDDQDIENYMSQIEAANQKLVDAFKGNLKEDFTAAQEKLESLGQSLLEVITTKKSDMEKMHEAVADMFERNKKSIKPK